jgi:hypothetical protein
MFFLKKNCSIKVVFLARKYTTHFKLKKSFRRHLGFSRYILNFYTWQYATNGDGWGNGAVMHPFFEAEL